jgi:propanol-preferring alcohol dehydrogenase
VSRIGQQASDAGLQEGDHVVVVPGWSDGTCRHWRVGNTQLCPNVRFPGFGPHGAEFILVAARYLVKMPRQLSFE